MGDAFFQLGLPLGRTGLSDLLLQSSDLARKFRSLLSRYVRCVAASRTWY